ncbi:hypothetical protein M413DRAFT_70744 [Hebeloma cylindrosporum]|uniref:Uncharacterized protein n=1 Tax=Hebeloma cylindrosporum TaxID=76867 RepID=A0A0C3CE44_HEBCY|nr:hypothetical protein M413DRAFT_70744 [Hebeloma cylindrosporum h7]
MNTLQFGVLEIGSFVGVFLFGVMFLQTFNYYNMYPEDGWVHKALVCVRIAEVAHTVAINYQIYRTTIVYYGKVELLLGSSALAAVPISGGFITLLVQIFFALRLTKFLPRPYNKIGALCVAVSTVRFGGAIYLTVITVASSTMAEYLHKGSWIISATFTLSAAVDVTIASSMLYYLAQQRQSEMHRWVQILYSRP